MGFTYEETERNEVLDFANELEDLISDNDAKTVFSQIQNYMLEVISQNQNNKELFYRVTRDLKYVEDARRQASLIPAMNTQTICENLSFKMFL